MAKEPTTPKAKATKPVKAGGIAKRTPVKASPAKASPAGISLAIIDKDVIFLWKCIKTSSMKASASDTLICLIKHTIACQY